MHIQDKDNHILTSLNIITIKSLCKARMGRITDNVLNNMIKHIRLMGLLKKGR